MIPQSNPRENPFPPEWESTISRVERFLAGGTPRSRLQVIAGIDSSELDILLSRRAIGRRYDQEEATGKAMQALGGWIDDEEKTLRTSAEGFAVTPTFNAIQNIIERARQSRKLVAIVGGVGVGKSEAAKAYAKAHPRSRHHPGAARIEFKESHRTPSAALEKILHELEGDVGHAYRNSHMLDAIASACRPGDCLILDECNYLREASNIGRDLHSLGIPVVMVGNPDFARAVYGKKSSFAALASRALRYEFNKTTEDDVDAWLAWSGLFGLELRRVAVDIAVQSGDHGGLRSLALLVDECRESFPDQPIDAGMLYEVARTLHRLN